MIQEGTIWTYYDCSHRCFLFGNFELPCIFMPLSCFLTTLILIGLIYYFRFKSVNRDK